MRNLKKLQKSLEAWQIEHFGDNVTSKDMFLGAVEEIGEIAHIILKSKHKIRKYKEGNNDTAKTDIADGIADATIFLMQMSTKMGLDFEDILFTTAENVMKRNWKENRSNGETKETNDDRGSIQQTVEKRKDTIIGHAKF